MNYKLNKGEKDCRFAKQKFEKRKFLFVISVTQTPNVIIG